MQQEWCARREGRNLARNVYKLKTKDKTAFYSPTDAWVTPAPRGAIIRGGFRGVDAHAEQEGFEHQPNWKPFENPGTPQR